MVEADFGRIGIGHVVRRRNEFRKSMFTQGYIALEEELTETDEEKKLLNGN